MLAFFEKEIVDKRKWLTHDEYTESVAMGQTTPGPLTIMNAFIGFKVFGFWGAIGAVMSTYVPSILVVTWIAHHYNQFKNSDIVSSTMRGLKPVVIALIAGVGISLGLHSLTDNLTVVLATGSLILLIYTKIDPIFIIIVPGVLGAVFL